MHRPSRRERSQPSILPSRIRREVAAHIIRHCGAMRIGIEQAFERQPLGRIHLRVVIFERAIEIGAFQHRLLAPAPRRASATNGRGRRCAGSSSHAAIERKHIVKRKSRRRASRVPSCLRHRAERERAGDAPDAARCAARCGARAKIRAPAPARNSQIAQPAMDQLGIVRAGGVGEIAPLDKRHFIARAWPHRAPRKRPLPRRR